MCSNDNSTINSVGQFVVKTTRLFSSKTGLVFSTNLSEAALSLSLRDSGVMMPARVASMTPDKAHVCIAMDQGNTTLHDYINTTSWNDRMVALPDIFFNVLECLSRLHARGIAHLDIKPENIIIAICLACHLIDLGGARFLNRGVPARVMGTPRYMAPEALAGEPASFACDAWSFGATLFAYIYKAPPTVPLPTVCPQGCPRVVFNAMIRMLDPCAATRLCLREIHALLAAAPSPPPPSLIKDVPIFIDTASALSRNFCIEWLFVHTRFVGAAPLAVSLYDRFAHGADTTTLHLMACAELACAVLYPDLKMTVPDDVRDAMTDVAAALHFELYADTCEWVLARVHGIERPDMRLVNVALKEAYGSTRRAAELYLEMASGGL